MERDADFERFLSETDAMVFEGGAMKSHNTADRPEIVTKTEARQATSNRLNLRVLIGSLILLAVVFAIIYFGFIGYEPPA